MTLRVLGFGTYDIRAHPRVEVLLEGLRRQGGTRVVELDRPLGLSTADRVAILKQPWRLPVLATRLAARWSSLVAGSVRFHGRNAPDAVLVGYMGHFDVLLARILYPRTTIVLDHLVFAAGTARDRGENGIRARVLSILDSLATRAADIIVLDTEEHAALLDTSVRAHGVVVPVGAPDAWYEAGSAPSHCSQEHDPLSIVFFGLYTPLQGAVTIAKALRELARRGVVFSATMVGTGQDRQACEALLRDVDQVSFRDWVDAEELPGLVASHDVCLGITGTTPKARVVVPNKVYQGLAAGCAVVTSDTAPQRRVLGDGGVLVDAGSAEAMADALEHLASDREALDGARTRARAVSQAFTPEHVVEPLFRRLTREGH